MNEWITPSIAGGLLLIGSVITVFLNTRTARSNAAEQRAPDVMQAWREADQARANARAWEDLYYNIKNSFKGYARRMNEMCGEETAALSMREHESLTKATPSSEPINQRKDA